MSLEKRNSDNFSNNQNYLNTWDDSNSIRKTSFEQLPVKQNKKSIFSWMFEKKEHKQSGFINKQMPFMWHGK